MKCLAVVFILLTLCSCISFQSSPVTMKSEKNQVTSCNPFINYSDTPPPKVRELTAEELRSRAAVEKALVEIISEQRRYAQNKYAQYEEAYKIYLRECK